MFICYLKRKNKQFNHDWITNCIKLNDIAWRYKLAKIISENPKKTFDSACCIRNGAEKYFA